MTPSSHLYDSLDRAGPSSFFLGLELPRLHELIDRICTAQGRPPFDRTVLAIDPGETTGLTQITRYKDVTMLRYLEQVPGWPLEEFIPQSKMFFAGVSICVYEAYHVYSWRLDEHRFSEVPTIQIIGAIKTLCIQNGIQYFPQTAQIGKAFFTDERLKSLGMYIPGKPHARDSLRHAAQFLTFGLKHGDADTTKGP